MIRVRYKERNRKRKIVIEGHANAGPEGNDLVCAGVSTLALTLQAALDVNEIRYNADVRDGYVMVRTRDPDAASVYNTVMCGIETLRVMYPEAIDVEYVG